MSVGLQEQQAENRLEELRSLLLAQDRASHSSVMERLAELEQAMVDDETFAERLSPYMEDQVKYLQQEFPSLFGKFLGPAIKQQIQDERDVIIDALYPIIGKLIARYLKEEIQRISEKLDESLKDPFSLSNIKLRLKAMFSSVSYEELLFKEIAGTNKLEEVFIIQKNTGISMAHYSLNEVTRSQMVAGMLTGIKNFMEDAFQKGAQELDTLEYDKYQIKLFPYSRFYIATVIEGTPDAKYERVLKQKVDEFCASTEIPVDSEVTNEVQERLSYTLKKYFDAFNQKGSK